MAKAPRLKNAVRDLIDQLQRKSDKLNRRKKYQDSVALLFEAVALIPSPAWEYTEYQWLWFGIAERYTSMLAFEDAVAAYEKLAASPGVIELPMYHIGLGQCLRALGRPEESLSAFCEGKRWLEPSEWKEFFRELGEDATITLIEGAE